MVPSVVVIDRLAARPRHRWALLAMVALPAVLAGPMAWSQTAPAAAAPPAAAAQPVAPQPAPVAASPAPASTATAAAAPAVPPPVPAARAVPAAQAALPDPATILLRQADYWRGQGKVDNAASSLRRLLELQPSNIEALGLLAQIDFEQGDANEGQQLFDRLRQAAPNDPRIPDVELAMRLGEIDQSVLKHARDLASTGQAQEAVQVFQQAFRGPTPPPSLALEYYTALGNTGLPGFEEARRQLGGMVAADPKDSALALAYARLLCNREFTRNEGIARLQALADVPSVSASARATWRQVLLWQGPTVEAMAQLRAYLAVNKSDPEIDTQYQNFVANLPTDAEQAHDRGFEELETKQWDQAEKDFEKALTYDPKDWKAMAMLAAIRNHENRTEDAHNLIEQAIAVKPMKKDYIIQSAGGDWSAEALKQSGQLAKYWSPDDARRAAEAGARQATAEYDRVTYLSRRGQYRQAEALLRHLGGRNRAGLYAQLGDIQTAAGQTAQARASYEQSLRLARNNPQAAAGMARLLDQQGDADGAARYYAIAEAGYRRGRNGRGLASMDGLRANMISARAAATTDPVQQIALYRQAVAIEPADPWNRLALARALQGQGQSAEARGVMAQTADRRDTPAIEAQVYFAEANHDNAGAAFFIARLPAHHRTGQMRDLADQVALEQELARIEVMPSGTDRRAALLALAAHPDPSGERIAAIADALIKLGDRPAVAEAARESLDASGSPTVPQRVAISGALAEAGQTEQAADLVADLNEDELPREQAQTLGGVKDSIAIARSDQFNAKKRPAEAYDTLEPRLAAKPNDPDLRLALSRLYATNGQPGEALTITRAVLRDNENDLNVRRSAIGSAEAAGDYPLAQRLVREGIRQSPDSLDLYMQAASIDQQQGDNDAALRDLKAARTLRLRQLAEARPAE